MFELRRLRPEETDYEQIGLLVSGVAFVVAIGWFKLALPIPACHLRTFVGIPCPTCGTTRCLRSFLEGAWPEAFFFNPAIFLLLLGAVGASLYAVAVLAFRLPRVRLKPLSALAARWTARAACAVLLANWIFVIASQGGRP